MSFVDFPFTSKSPTDYSFFLPSEAENRLKMSNSIKKRTLDAFFKPPPKKAKVEDEISKQVEKISQDDEVGKRLHRVYIDF